MGSVIYYLAYQLATAYTSSESSQPSALNLVKLDGRMT